MLKIRAPKDFFAGILFVAIGVTGALMASHYAFGSALRMGPGYLPMILSSITALLGLAILGRSFAIDGEPVARIVWRPLVLITAAIVLFGVTITQLGLVAAVIITVLVGGFAARDMGKLELVLVALGLALFSAVVFVYGLGQPMQLWPV
ncbi:MAG: tripartite tricarboxylate transporter TctB family protein [Rhizobiales bacterium]|nr:tripartite tricarboxylate transporter TctB family protein [Hyphomicrobiales bacterium]